MVIRQSQLHSGVVNKLQQWVVSVWDDRPPSATVVSAEPFSHGMGTLRCLQKEMATYGHWSVSLWWDPDDVPRCRILSLTKLDGGLSRLHSADEDTVSWLTSYGWWYAYKKKKMIWQSLLKLQSMPRSFLRRVWRRLNVYKSLPFCSLFVPANY